VLQKEKKTIIVAFSISLVCQIIMIDDDSKYLS